MLRVRHSQVGEEQVGQLGGAIEIQVRARIQLSDGGAGGHMVSGQRGWRWAKHEAIPGGSLPRGS